MLHYGIIEYSSKLKWGNEYVRFQRALDFFELRLKDDDSTFETALSLHESIKGNLPKAGISLKVFWSFYNEEKSEYEKACLLGFIALKSIIQNKTYCKVTNNFWLARMDGKSHAVKSIKELSMPIQKFATEYQTKKIKDELILNWGLTHYSKYMRGFAISFKMNLSQLIYQIEINRSSYKRKKLRNKERAIRNKIIQILSNEE